MEGADAAGMAGSPGLQEVQRLGAAHLADWDTIWPQAQRRPHEVGERGRAVLGAQRHQVRRGALQLAGVLDQDDPVACLGDLGEKRIDQRRLTRRGAARHEEIAALANRTAQQIGFCPRHDAGLDVVVEREHRDRRTADGETGGRHNGRHQAFEALAGFRKLG